MTEASAENPATYETKSMAAVQHVGEVVVAESAQDRASAENISVGDLVRLKSAHIWDEFVEYGRPRKLHAEKELQTARDQRRKLNFELLSKEIEPTLVYEFVREKTTQFMATHADSPVLREARPVLPQQMMLANLRQLREDKIKGAKQNRGAFLAKQEAHEKIATDLASFYPEVQFARALQHAFEDRQDPKYASYAADVVNAAGRTLRILGRLSQANEGSPTS